MEQKVLFFDSPLKERIWGGKYFKDILKVTNSDENIGEMWSLSAHKEGDCIITNGKLKGMTLSECYNKYRHLFNNSTLDEFPILVKLIATSDKLSVQVHPDDEYAKKIGCSYGKTEGWLFLDCEEESSIVIGHNAKNEEELRNYVNNDDYDSLLRTVKVKKGEFYPIPARTIHALGKGLVLLEVQQSSDTTYRFFDYHRLDKNGKERQLHLKEAIECSSYDSYNEKIVNVFESNSQTVWDNKYFDVRYEKVDGKYMLDNSSKNYYIISVVDGNIKIMNKTLKIGESAIITSQYKSCKISGNGSVIITKSHF